MFRGSLALKSRFGCGRPTATASSLKTFEDFNQIPLRIFPSELYLGNYPSAWNSVPFGRYFINTAIIVSLSVVGELISASIVGFGFSRLKFWGRNFLFMVLLSTMMLPFWVVIIPRFLLYRDIGWVGTWLPLIVPSYFANPVYVFLMRQFFMTLPAELDDAAKIDGCNELGIYWRILLPLTKPVLATIAIFSFINVWTDFVKQVIYLSQDSTYTVAIGLAFLRWQIAQGDPVPGLLMAATVFTSLPMIAIFFVGQKCMVRGIALTGRTGT
ncbi:MAG: carbohydrate ABC transporter permease [Caldilineaceae bacterium SB0668_bin_21]|nr:carbohydrate ABC transporter permease [Caldilineaceae bacterium SB0668_bin_21]MYC20292.1 carbohydrate ABC transporter permease [Caldilineaceae bacterium SB0662_bin_25]